MNKFLFLLLTLALLGGCSSPPIDVYDDELDTSDYIIGRGDNLYISVWKNPELSISIPVRPDGKISVPLVGDEKAEGLSARELSENLTEKLTKFIRAPQVTVMVTAANSSEFLTRVRITGAVNQPQSIPYRRGMTILDLVLQAGGLTAFADANDAILYRKTPDGTVPYDIEVDEILTNGNLKTNYQLRPSDILIIPESVF